MFHKVPGAEAVEIEHLTCWIPPPPKDKTQILFHEYPTKEQYWRRSLLPDYYKELWPEELMRQKEEAHLVDQGKIEKVTYFNPVLERYRQQEWNRRLFGVHFLNNGEVTYLTGAHYFYLQWCQFDHPENDSYPFFYQSQLRRFRFREYCAQDSHSLGYVLIGARGFGKTSEETAVILESLTRGPRRRRAALQSKSEDDARDVIYRSKFVPVFKSLPDFFKPVFNHGSNPETKLSFFRSAKRGTKARDVIYGPEHELENVIFFVNAKEKELDGETLAEILNDEIGKTDPKKEADVYKRMNVNRFCVFRNSRKTGLIRATTTVEEMDKGGDECKKVWDESDQRVRTENGFTISGLYRMFISCLETSTQKEFVDKYGNVDEETAKEWHTNERQARKHDIHALSSWMRKNPFNEDEAFIKDASHSVFNVFTLTERLQELHKMKNYPYIRGNFFWKDKKDGEVEFKEDSHAGRFYVHKLLDVEQKHENQKKLANNIGYYTNVDGAKVWQPQNDRLYRIGTDPIKYSKTKDPRASKAAMHVMELYNDAKDHGLKMEEWTTHNLILEYIHRPDDPETYYEDLIMLIRYYGCSVLIESNIKELIKHLVDRGYEETIIFKRNYDPDEAFIQNTRTDDGGISSTKEVIDSYVRRLIAFVNKHGKRIMFPRTIESLLEFEPENTTMHDASVSAGYTLLAGEAQIEEDVEIHDVGEWFDEFDQSGRRSQAVDDDHVLDAF